MGTTAVRQARHIRRQRHRIVTDTQVDGMTDTTVYLQKIWRKKTYWTSPEYDNL